MLVVVDWNMTHMVHHGCVGITLKKEVFTDPDSAGNLAILSQMLKILTLALEVLNEESSALGLDINWSKNKIQTSCDMKPSTVSLLIMRLMLWTLTSFHTANVGFRAHVKIASRTVYITSCPVVLGHTACRA